MTGRLLFCLWLAFASGCSQSYQRIDVEVVNHAAVDLHEVNVRFGTSSSCYFGVLSKDARAVYMHFEQPIGETVEVTWVEPNGDNKTANARLDAVYTRGRPGELAFEIRSDGVQASFREFDADGKLPPPPATP